MNAVAVEHFIVHKCNQRVLVCFIYLKIGLTAIFFSESLYYAIWRLCYISCVRLYQSLRGVVVSVLVIRFKIRGFRPCRGEGFLRAIKIRNTPSLWGGLAGDPMSQDFTACKNHLQVLTKILHEASLSFLSSIPFACYHMTLLVGLPESSGGRVRRFPLSTLSFQHGPQCSCITWGMNNRPLGGCNSET
jgi:hypothetical protein